MATAAQLRLDEGKQAVIDFDPVWIGRSVYDLTDITLTAYLTSSLIRQGIPDS